MTTPDPSTFAARAVVALAAFACAPVMAAAPGPCLRLEHANGYTLNAGGELVRFAALRVCGGKVLASSAGAADAARKPAGRVVDAGGRTVLPGLIDAHGHVMALGTLASSADLSAAPTLAATLAAITSFAAAHPANRWIRGRGWNQEVWRLGRFPRAAELDTAVAARPALLWRVDGHAVWVNSAALLALGIDAGTPDPPGGRIERDAAGRPSGVLVDAAAVQAEARLPAPSPAERDATLAAALATLTAAGLTSVHDAGTTPEDWALYQQFARAGRLPVRIYAMLRGVSVQTRPLLRAGPVESLFDDRLALRAVKLVADGALGSRGAALLEPYADAPGDRGLLFQPASVIGGWIAEVSHAGFQVNVHAIGDAANREVLDGFADSLTAAERATLRPRIEHAQVVAPTDLPRFAALQVIASMQPTHATSDMNMAEARVGADRLVGAYAWRTLLGSGARLAFGSDFPVESPNPFYGLHAAVTRSDHRGEPPGGWHGEQALTLTEALRAFSTSAAYAAHQEAVLGSLEPGKWADFIVVDRDPFAIASADLWKIQVLETWVAGERVYAAPASRVAAAPQRPVTRVTAVQR